MSPAELSAKALDDWLLIVDQAQSPLGWCHVPSQKQPVGSDELNRAGTVVPQDGSLRQFLDAALSSSSGRGAVVDAAGKLR